MGKQSNFGAIDQALNVFGRKAQYLALADFLERMSRVYKKSEANLMDEMKLYQMKVRDPKEFSKEIENTTRVLNNLKNLMNDTLEEIDHEYSGSETRGGKIQKDADDVVQKYKEEVEKINGKNWYSLEQLEKISLRQVDIFRDYQKRLSDELLHECNAKLKMTLQGGAVSVISLQPDFTEESIKIIKEQRKEEAYEMKWEEGGTFTRDRRVPRFSDARFYDLVKNDIMGRIDKIKGMAIKSMRNFATEVIDYYKTQLVENINSKQSELQSIKQDQRENNEIRELLKGKEQLLTQIDKNKNTLQDYIVMLDDVLKASQNQVKGE